MAALGALLRFFAPRGRLAGGFGFGRTWPENNQNISNLLHLRGVELTAYEVDQGRALLPLPAHHAYLDQLVTHQRDIDFMQYGGGEAGPAYHHDRLQMVGTGPERPALGRSKLLHEGVVNGEQRMTHGNPV